MNMSKSSPEIRAKQALRYYRCQDCSASYTVGGHKHPFWREYCLDCAVARAVGPVKMRNGLPICESCGGQVYRGECIQCNRRFVVYKKWLLPQSLAGRFLGGDGD